MNNIAPIFKSQVHQDVFDKKGYLVLDFFNEQEVLSLIELFHELHKDIPQNRFMSDSYVQDKSYKKEASDKITAYFKPYFETILDNYTSLGSTFLYKSPGIGSELSMHQDWTIVDEEKHVALNIWVPLCDTNAKNGTIYVVPGSHLHILPLRAPTLPFFFSGNEDVVFPYLIPLDLMAGQALILSQRLIHYSPPNRSDDIRIAITSGVKTKDAQMLFYYKDPSGPTDILEVYEQEDDFLISFNNFFEDIRNRPYLGKRLSDIQYRVPLMDRDTLKSLLDSMYLSAGIENNTSKDFIPDRPNWFNKIRRLVNI